jgi:hypothetical protein
MVAFWVLAVIAVAAIVALQLNRTKNESPGAINNASGLGVFLELAENFTKKPLSNYNLTFVATGAEEFGLMGAISYFKAHESEFDPEETYFLNIKEAAVRGHFYIPGPIGFPPQFPCLLIETLFKKVLNVRKIPLKEGEPKMIRVLSPWVLTGSWNDDMVPVIRGFNANRISIGGHGRKRKVINTKNDTIDQVDIEAMDIVGKVTAEVLQRLDLRARP